MDTRVSNNVTLSHDDAQRVASLLGDYADTMIRRATATRNETIRVQCRADASEARRTQGVIVAALWTWKTDEVPATRADANADHVLRHGD